MTPQRPHLSSSVLSCPFRAKALAGLTDEGSCCSTPSRSQRPYEVFRFRGAPLQPVLYPSGPCTSNRLRRSRQRLPRASATVLRRYPPARRFASHVQARRSAERGAAWSLSMRGRESDDRRATFRPALLHPKSGVPAIETAAIDRLGQPSSAWLEGGRPTTLLRVETPQPFTARPIRWSSTLPTIFLLTLATHGHRFSHTKSSPLGVL